MEHVACRLARSLFSDAIDTVAVKSARWCFECTSTSNRRWCAYGEALQSLSRAAQDAAVEIRCRREALFLTKEAEPFGLKISIEEFAYDLVLPESSGNGSTRTLTYSA